MVIERLMKNDDDSPSQESSAITSIDDIVAEQRKGAILTISDLRRGDGILTRNSPSYQSLLHRAITPVEPQDDDKHYRTELKIADFGTDREADQAAAALDECRTLCMPNTPVVDLMIARSAGKNHSLLFKILDTLTHSTFTTNYQGNNKSGKHSSSSPLG